MANPSPRSADAPAWLVRSANVTWRLLVLAAAVWLISALAVRMTLVCVTVALGLLIAGVFSPVTGWAVRRGAPDWAAPLGVVLVLLLAIGGTGMFLGARISEQVPELRQQLDDAAADLSRTLGVQVSVPFGGGGQGQQGQSQQDQQDQGGQNQNQQNQNQQNQDQQTQAQQQQAQQNGQQGSTSGGAADEAADIARLALETLIAFFLALALGFLFLKDGAAMWRWVLSKCGAGVRGDVDAAGRAAWSTVGTYVRGLTVVALFDAVGIGIGLVVLGVPLALTLAVLQFVASYIPTIGAFVAGAVAVGIAYVNGGLLTAGLTLALVVVVQQIGNDVIEPWVMGRTLALHPAVVLIAVTAGGVLWGIPGALLFVPLAAALSAAGHVLWSRHHAPEPVPRPDVATEPNVG